ncbi:MAG: AraC family transcriptional regulator [Dokdonella sp.]|nr:MAG: AraC family transcriptional regulator [Dokdonella sp.]
MHASIERWRHDFLARVAAPHYVEALFDRLPDIVFSLKDRSGRYVAISQAAVARCGLRHKRDALGKTAFDLFPRPMAERYTRQDEHLFRSGRPIVDNLDLTIYRDGSSGWCLSTKEPLRDAQGQLIGLACISKDLVEPTRAHLIDAGFAAAIDHLLEHCDRPLRIDELARRAHLSPAQFDRRMKKIFQLSAGQYLIKTRIDHAARLLGESDLAIAEIALQSGFADQSGLSRQFRHVTGLTPRQYRQLLRG